MNESRVGDAALGVRSVKKNPVEIPVGSKKNGLEIPVKLAMKFR